MMGDATTGETIKLQDSIKIATTLYHILEKRRRKEGKITFESTEIYFDFENGAKV